MNIHTLKMIQTVVVAAVLIGAHFFTKKVVRNFLKKFRFTAQRRKLTIRIVNLLLSIIAIVFIAGIWGVKQTDMVLFISSVMTVLGIAFVAQWSLLSNITAALVLFFNHPLRIGDHIKIIEKDFIIEGIITDITFFFVQIKTSDKERVSISNTIFIQKTISVVQQNEVKRKNIEEDKQKPVP